MEIFAPGDKKSQPSGVHHRRGCAAGRMKVARG
jgi:hypothetical protein